MLKKKFLFFLSVCSPLFVWPTPDVKSATKSWSTGWRRHENVYRKCWFVLFVCLYVFLNFYNLCLYSIIILWYENKSLLHEYTWISYKLYWEKFRFSFDLEILPLDCGCVFSAAKKYEISDNDSLGLQGWLAPWLGRQRTRAFVNYYPICQNKKIGKNNSFKIDVISIFLRNNLLSICLPRPQMIRDLRPANSKHNQEFIYKYNCLCVNLSLCCVHCGNFLISRSHMMWPKLLPGQSN